MPLATPPAAAFSQECWEHMHTTGELCPITDTYDGPCFQAFNDTHTDTIGVTVACGSDGNGGTASTCSGYTRQDKVGAVCRSICDKPGNSGYCRERAETYYLPDAMNPDVACVRPNNFNVWGKAEYSYIETFVAENPGLRMPTDCFWPPCFSENAGTATIPNWGAKACPPVNMTCMVSGVTVVITNVQAQHLSVVDQHCVSGKGPVKTETSHTSLKSAFQRMSIEEKIGGAIGIAVVVLACAVAAAMTVVWYRSRGAESVLLRAARAISAAAPPRTAAAAPARGKG